MNGKIKKIKCRFKKRMAKKLKITITADNGKRFILPGIPFWFLVKTASIALFFVKLAMKREKHKLPVTKKEIYEIINCLRKEPPFTLVEVIDKKGNLVEIKTV